MRILTLTTSYPDGPEDYRGVFVAELATALEALGHQIRVVTPGSGSLFHSDGVAETLRRRPWLAAQIPPGLLHLARSAHREALNADLVISHWLLPCGLLGTALRRRGGPPHLIIEHGGGLRALETLPAPLARRLLRWIAEGTDAVQAVAPHIRARLAALCPTLEDRIFVEPMGVPPPSSAPVSPAPPPPLQVLVAGRLLPRKGVAVLIEAAAAAPEVIITIVGDGPERTRLEAQAQPLGGRVRFLGEQPPAALDAIYPSHHVVAAPAIPYQRGAEGTPTSVLRAMAAGLVPVASKTGGLADLLASGREGILVPPGDPMALADALVHLAEDPSRLAGCANRARTCGQDHLWPQVAERVDTRLRAIACGWHPAA